MDKLVMYRDQQDQQIRECVRCHYTDTIGEDGNIVKIQPEEIKTRVNQPRAGEDVLPHEDEVQIVNIMDPNPGAKRKDH